MGGPWWGETVLEDGQAHAWRAGPVELGIERRPAEFRLEIRNQETGGEPELVRYGVSPGDRRVAVLPATADRPLIVKSATEFIVPPSGTATAFVSSPLWIAVRLRDPDRLLRDFPIRRPTDTWFGPSTLVGELGYAIRTSVRYDLDNVAPREDRAVSVVRILNHGSTPLPLARIRLPLPHLSLYADEGGRLWTESLTLDRRSDDDVAEIQLSRSAPGEAGRCTLVTGPREAMSRRSVFRSFAGLLGMGDGKTSHERVVE